MTSVPSLTVLVFTFFAPGRHPGPVAEVALGRVVALEHVSVPTLKQTHYTLNIHLLLPVL